MAKWVKLNTTYFNLSQMQQIYRQGSRVLIDNIPVADLEDEEEAEKFIEDFIDEHYITTNKVE